MRWRILLKIIFITGKPAKFSRFFFTLVIFIKYIRIYNISNLII